MTEGKIAAASKELNGIMGSLKDVHGEPVAETEDMVVFMDNHGHELGDIAHDIEGVGRGDVSEWMHSKARDVYGRSEATGAGDPWSKADPVVVLMD